MIQILADRNSAELANIDQAKIIAHRKVGKAVSDILHTKRWVLFEYPTLVNAHNAKMSTEEWEHFVYNACLVDWSSVATEQEALKKLTATG